MVEAAAAAVAAAPVARGRRRAHGGATASAILGALVVVLCAALIPAGAEAMAANEAEDSNNLGLLAQACAESFCGVGVDALDLWLSLEETCNIGPSAQPYLDGLFPRASGQPTLTTWGAEETEGWSPTATALVCAGVWSLSVYAGFRSGIKVGTQTKGGYPVA